MEPKRILWQSPDRDRGSPAGHIGREVRRGGRRKWIAILVAAAACLVAGVATADDYECMDEAGCDAILSNDEGTRTVTFRRGDVLSTGSGWVIDPADGWVKVDFVCPYTIGLR